MRRPCASCTKRPGSARSIWRSFTLLAILFRSGERRAASRRGFIASTQRGSSILKTRGFCFRSDLRPAVSVVPEGTFEAGGESTQHRFSAHALRELMQYFRTCAGLMSLVPRSSMANIPDSQEVRGRLTPLQSRLRFYGAFASSPMLATVSPFFIVGTAHI